MLNDRIYTVAEYAAEVGRLERALLANDGWRCDGCQRVYSVDDVNRGEDCDLCEGCAVEATR
jgi:hypothetical protein